MMVLIVEADATIRRSLETTLVAWGYKVLTTSDRAQAWEVLERESPPLLVVLGTLNEAGAAVRLCQDIRKRKDGGDVYILLLAGSKQEITEGTEAGADDYVSDPSDLHELRIRLHGGRRMVELRHELSHARETIRYQLHHDPLTGLWNRAAIIEILQRELARAKREGSRVAVFMAALDGLKIINDAYGHAAGDHVVRVAARRMRSSLRPYDELGRYAGGIFLMVIPGCYGRGASKQAERLQACISAHPIEISPWGKLPQEREGPAAMAVTISLGVTIGTGHNAAEALLGAVEDAVARARSSGVNRIEESTIPQGPSEL
jgi:two-component system cell cycle response regulator